MLQCVRLRGSEERPCRLQMHPAFQTESRGSLAKANVSAFDGVHDHSSPSDFANACSIPDSAPPGEIRVGPIEYPRSNTMEETGGTIHLVGRYSQRQFLDT